MALGDLPKSPAVMTSERGARVIAWAKMFLDDSVPLAGASWADVTGFDFENGELKLSTAKGETTLADPAQYTGFKRDNDRAYRLYFEKRTACTRLVFGRSRQHDRQDRSRGASGDIGLESALSHHHGLRGFDCPP